MFASSDIKDFANDHHLAKAVQKELIEIAKNNLANQQKTHQAILKLLDAETFDDAIRVIVCDFPELLDLDFVSLVLETDDYNDPSMYPEEIGLVEPGGVDKILNHREVVLAENTEGNSVVFGHVAKLTKSYALVKLEMGASAPLGIIAFGSKQKDLFRPNQGVELLSFLSLVVAKLLRKWLKFQINE